jgi:CheY-like chemotaxis protein
MEEFATSPRMNRTRAVERPLLGLTILLVEDSRYFADAVRLMAIRSGARLRRADCIHSAHKHTRIYRPDAILVDLGLPDGAGQDLIKEMSRVPNAPPVIAISGGDQTECKEQAMAAGATIFLQKPFFDLASFQQTILSIMPETSDANGFKPRVAGDQVHPDKESLVEDYEYVSQIIQEAMQDENPEQMQYAAQFLNSVARVSADDDLIAHAVTLNTKLNTDRHWALYCDHVLALLAARIDA